MSLRFTLSIRGGRCDHWHRAPKTPASMSYSSYTNNVTSGRRCKRISVLHTAPMRCSRYLGVSSEFLQGSVSYACRRNSVVSTLTIILNGRFEVLIPVWAKDLPLTRSGIPSLPRNIFLALLLVVRAARAWG
jgi:hypothetical protein